MKHLKDIPHEHHNELVRYPKMALKGAFLGSVAGYLHFVGAPTGAFELEKLMAATGSRQFSGRTFRFMRHVLAKPAAMGAGSFFLYNYIVDWRRGHQDAHMKPRYYDHAFSMTVLSLIGASMYMKHPMQIFMAGVATLWIGAPVTWLVYLKRRDWGKKNHVITY